MTYSDIAAGSACTVTETDNGSTSAVSVTTVGGDQTVTVGAADEETVEISDTYGFVPWVPGRQQGHHRASGRVARPGHDRS